MYKSMLQKRCLSLEFWRIRRREWAFSVTIICPQVWSPKRRRREEKEGEEKSEAAHRRRSERDTDPDIFLWQ